MRETSAENEKLVRLEDEAAPTSLETHVRESGPFGSSQGGLRAPGVVVGPPHHVVKMVQPHGVLMTVRMMLEIVVVAVFVVTFLVQPSRIGSESMEPTMKVWDGLLVDKQSYAPRGWMDFVLPPESVKRGDLVVFHFALEPGVDLVKRVVALPGERVHLHSGRVFVNGEALVEPYAFYATARPNGFRDEFPSLRETDPNVDARWWMQLRREMVGGEVVVPRDCYFVLGDNRNDSADSRYWGFVPRAALEGRPLVVDFAVRPGVDRTLGAKLRYAWGSLRVLR